MGYNYRNGMPDYHASATDISSQVPGSIVHDSAATVNPSTPNQNNNSFVQQAAQGGLKSATDMEIAKGLSTAVPAVGSAIKSGVGALVGLL